EQLVIVVPCKGPGLAVTDPHLLGDVALGVVGVVPGAVGHEAIVRPRLVAGHVAVAVGVEAVATGAGARELVGAIVAVIGRRAAVERFRGQPVGGVVTVGPGPPWNTSCGALRRLWTSTGPRGKPKVPWPPNCEFLAAATKRGISRFTYFTHFT